MCVCARAREPPFIYLRLRPRWTDRIYPSFWPKMFSIEYIGERSPAVLFFFYVYRQQYYNVIVFFLASAPCYHLTGDGGGDDGDTYVRVHAHLCIRRLRTHKRARIQTRDPSSQQTLWINNTYLISVAAAIRTNNWAHCIWPIGFCGSAISGQAMMHAKWSTHWWRTRLNSKLLADEFRRRNDQFYTYSTIIISKNGKIAVILICVRRVDQQIFRFVL